MTRYVLKRIAWSALTLLLFVTALFFLVNILMPGDFMTQFRLGLTAEQRAELAAQLGLDRSLWAQFWDWLSGLAVGDLGTSFVGNSVAAMLRSALATSMMVFLTGVLIAFPLGNWLGRIGAWKGRGPFLGSTTFVAIVFFTAFPPSLAFMLRRGLGAATTPQQYLDITSLDGDSWREPGAPSPFDLLWRMVLVVAVVLLVIAAVNAVVRRARGRGLPAAAVIALYLSAPWAIWILLGWRSRATDVLGTLLMLIVGVVVVFYGEIQLVTEAAMEDTIDADFVTTARAKGLTERQVRDHHAARAAVLPVISRMVVSIPYFLAGLTILEAVFDVPGGLGNLIFRAVRNQDNAIVVGSLVVVGALSLAARLGLDLLYAVLDPRIRYRSGQLEVGLD